MAFDLDRYKQVVGRLKVDDIDFDAFRDEPLRPSELRCLRYMHDVEQHTACYLRNLLNTKAHNDPEITEFLTMWNFEEHWHGEALGRVLAAHGEPGSVSRVQQMRDRLGWKLSSSPLLWMAFSAVTKHFIAVHMTFGVINEWTTQGGYSRLVTVAENPTLTELLKRIMRQEGRHIDYYLDQARNRLEASRGAQRTTRMMIKALWTPVGAKVMPEDDTKHLVRTLFVEGDGVDVAERIDRRIDSLPGLSGLGLMAGAIDRYGVAA
ncbi:MAG: ferritin-like domain-containing protein [Acidimicrobiales bacterium]